MKVTFFDLTAQYHSIKSEVDAAITSVLESGSFIGGNVVSGFEKNFALSCGTKHCVAVGNATDGLFLSLKALGVGPGDEVITPAWSWISSAEVISQVGAKPVFADVDPHFYTVSIKELQTKVTVKTKAVIVVHLYGQAVDIRPIVSLCKENGLFLIEDCAQAHFTELEGQKAGSFGRCGVFSFYPTKNLGAIGDGGCVTTNDVEFANHLRRWANHGGLEKDEHLFEGTNSRLDALQAAVLNVKLKHLPRWTNQRVAYAQQYQDQLAGIAEIVLPSIQAKSVHTFHQFVIQANQRDNLKAYLEKQGIQTLIHYPKALPFEPAYKHLKHTEDQFPVSARLQKSVLSLPIYPELSAEQIDYVCEMIRSFYGR